MDNSLLHHISLVTILYFSLLISFYGWGAFSSVVFNFNLYLLNGYFFLATWLGWCVTLGLFQLLHIFLPVDWKMSSFVYIIGIVLAAVLTINKIGKDKFSIIKTAQFAALFLALLGVLIWLSFKGLQPIQNGDSGLYHLPTMLWINEYPIIPGLGNLHGRLAFNQSFLVYAASLNFFPLFPYANSTANGFLFLLVFLEMSWHIIKMICNWRELVFPSTYSNIAYIIGLLLVAWWSIANKELGYLGYFFDINSPSPDLASCYIQLVLFIWFIRAIINYRAQIFSIELLFVLSILATTLITVKISNTIFAVTIVGMCLFYGMKLPQGKTLIIKSFGRTLAFLVIILLIWIVRGYYVSGYPFYPLSFGGLPVDWAIPKEFVSEMRIVIFSWARLPNHNPSEVLGNWQWLHPWLIRIYDDYKTSVIYPLSLSFLLMIFSFLILLIQKKQNLWHRDLVLFIPVGLEIVFWFFTAPDPRFAHASFFLVLLISIMIFFSAICESLEKIIGVLATQVSVLTIVITTLVFLMLFFYPFIMLDFQSKYTPIPTPILQEKQTYSALNLFIPTTSAFCWYAPLPCTIRFYPELKLRVDGDLSSGFTVK